ncbi:MAG: chemotaxis protein CheX [Desulfobacterales bacterium]
MDFYEKIIEVTKEIFESMIMLDVTPDQPLTEHVSKFTCSLSAMVGFAGFKQGNLVIHAPKEVAMGLTRDFLGIDINDINEDVQDAMGELANMIAGSLKPVISNNGKNIELSLPSVVYGEQYSMTVIAKADWIIVPFTISHGRFLVGLEFKNQD